MTSPRFVPRRLSLAPPLFGKADVVPWRDTRSQVERERLEASRLQHAYAVSIRRSAVEKYGSVKAYAEAANTPYDQLVKTLRGVVIMRLETIGQATVLIGDVHDEAMRVLAVQGRG